MGDRDGDWSYLCSAFGFGFDLPFDLPFGPSFVYLWLIPIQSLSGTRVRVDWMLQQDVIFTDLKSGQHIHTYAHIGKPRMDA